jgi:signal peptidase II
MTSFLVVLIAVPLLDQAVKLLVLRRLGRRAIPLGPLGHLRVVHAQIWMLRTRRSSNLVVMWTLWILAAVVLTTVPALVPNVGWFAGLLLGGSLSHAVETSLRGSVCDYVCLRFWPAFNIADVAVTIGAFGAMAQLLAVIQRS